MSPMPDSKHATSDVAELIDLLKRYVLQETIGPLKTMGRSLAYGGAAAVMIGLGAVFGLIGLLRVLETETGTTFRGDLSWAPYGLTVVAGVLVLALGAGLVLRGPRPASTVRAAESVANRMEPR